MEALIRDLLQFSEAVHADEHCIRGSRSFGDCERYLAMKLVYLLPSQGLAREHRHLCAS